MVKYLRDKNERIYHLYLLSVYSIYTDTAMKYPSDLLHITTCAIIPNVNRRSRKSGQLTSVQRLVYGRLAQMPGGRKSSVPCPDADYPLTDPGRRSRDRGERSIIGRMRQEGILVDSKDSLC